MMNKLLQAFGVLMLAQLLFVGLVHVFLKVQDKDTAESRTALHKVPVLGGFFPAPEVKPPELSPEEARERRAREALLDSREFFPLPAGMEAAELERMLNDVKDARTRYEQGLLDVESQRTNLARLRSELETEKDALVSLGGKLEEEAKNLQAGREELDLAANRVEAQELKNLKAAAVLYEQMEPSGAAAILGSLGPDTAAKVLAQMVPRKSGRILEALPIPRATEIARRMQALQPPTAETSAASASNTKR
jgi:flagellar motility protein MotE (MotC chaperone)